MVRQLAMGRFWCGGSAVWGWWGRWGWWGLGRVALGGPFEPARKRGVGGGWGSLSRGRGPAGIGD